MASQISDLSINNPKIGFIKSVKFVRRKSIRPYIHFQSPRLVTTTLPRFPFEDYKVLRRNQIDNALDETNPLNEALKPILVEEGDRLNPIICVATCEVVGGDESLAINTACALEMLVAMKLIKDDVAGWKSLLCSAIVEIASHARNVPPDLRVRAVKEICDAVGLRGFEMEMLGDFDRLKSVKLVEAAAVCGAIVGGGTELEIRKLRKYGKLVGIASQVCEDVLDEFRDEKKIAGTSLKLRGARKYVGQMVDEACRELSYFQKANAAPLYYIAHSFLSMLS